MGLAMWLCSYVGMWLCGYAAMWLCDYVARSLRGYVAAENDPIQTVGQKRNRHIDVIGIDGDSGIDIAYGIDIDIHLPSTIPASCFFSPRSLLVHRWTTSQTPPIHA